jgi:hypothetical protein
MSEGEKKGYVVRDRRRFDVDGAPRVDEEAEASRAEPEPARRAPEPARASAANVRGGVPQPPPSAARGPASPTGGPQSGPQMGGPAAGPQGSRAETAARRAAGEGVDFSSLVLSLATNAMISLQGGAGDERIPGGRPNLGAAAQHIEILLMLEEKTRGNLTPDEHEMLQSVLYDLRMSYVEIARQLGVG